MLYDAYGRPVQFEALREEQAAPTLAGIRNIYSSIDASIGLTPEKLVGVLRQAEFGDPWLYLELAERMEEKDLLYQGVLHTRKMAVTQLDIDVQAASDDPRDIADADFVREVLLEGDLNFHDALFDILDALGKGFSATEIIWDTDGVDFATGAPRWIPRELAWRDPRWFMFDWISGEQILVRTLRTAGPEIPDSSGRLTALTPRIVADSVAGQIGIQPATAPLAPFKFITHIAKAKSGLPVRGGLARVAAWSWLFKNYVLKDWVVFAEVFGQPLRVGKYGAGATENDKAALLKAVANIGTDAAAIIPDSMLIEFVNNKSETASIQLYEKLCGYLDKQVTIAVLGQELTTQLPKGAGSRAAAEVHDVVRRDIATDDARRLSASLTRDLVKPLIDLNRGPRRRYPKINIGFEEKSDLETLMNSMGPAIDRGMRVSEKWLRDQFGAPDPEKDETLLHPAETIKGQASGDSSAPDTTSPAPAAAISPNNLSPDFTDINGGENREQMAHKRKTGSHRHGAASAARQAPLPNQGEGRARLARAGQHSDSIDRFVAKLLEDETEPAMRPIIEPLIAKLSMAKDYREMKKLVAAAVAEMDLGPFAELLAKAGFNVNVAGNAGAKKH